VPYYNVIIGGSLGMTLGVVIKNVQVCVVYCVDDANSCLMPTALVITNQPVHAYKQNKDMLILLLVSFVRIILPGPVLIKWTVRYFFHPI